MAGELIFEEPQSATLAFFLSEDLANAIALPGGEPPGELHLTLVYFGEQVSLPVDQLQSLLKEKCRAMPPLTGRIAGIGRFSAEGRSGDEDVIYASFDSPGLLELRDELLVCVQTAGLEPDTTHGYTPHVTLAYVDPDQEVDLNLPFIEVEFSIITLAIGDNYYDFELLGESVTDTDKPSVSRIDWGVNDNVIIHPSSAVDSINEAIEKVNWLTPAQLEPLRPEEIVILTFIGADNLLNRGLGKWDVNDLPKLAALLPGLPLTLDHDWDQVSKVQGVIFEARVVHERVPVINPDHWTKPDLTYSQDGRNYAVFTTKKDKLAPIARAGNFEWNRRIVAEEGYQTCEFDVAFPANSPALQGLRFGQLSSISLGGFNYKDHICPLCKTSFSDERCPHFIPEAWAGRTHETDEQVAPYFIRSGVFDLTEASIVLNPNLPGAGVKQRGMSLVGVPILSGGTKRRA